VLQAVSDRDSRHTDYVRKRLEADIFPEIRARLVSEMPTSAFRAALNVNR